MSYSGVVKFASKRQNATSQRLSGVSVFPSSVAMIICAVLTSFSLIASWRFLSESNRKIELPENNFERESSTFWIPAPIDFRWVHWHFGQISGIGNFASHWWQRRCELGYRWSVRETSQYSHRLTEPQSVQKREVASPRLLRYIRTCFPDSSVVFISAKSSSEIRGAICRA